MSGDPIKLGLTALNWSLQGDEEKATNNDTFLQTLKQEAFSNLGGKVGELIVEAIGSAIPFAGILVTLMKKLFGEVEQTEKENMNFSEDQLKEMIWRYDLKKTT